MTAARRPGVLQWLRSRDNGLSATRRAARAAILMPSLFALADKGIGNPTIAVFASFGAMGTLLFVDFGGTMRERLTAQAALVGAGGVFICLGTLASQHVWSAALGMLVVGFAVLFAGVISSVLAGATTALLVGFVLPVTLPGPPGTIPDRLAGWFLAGAVSVAAIGLLWPQPTREPLRMTTAEACELLARRLRAEVECVRAGYPADRVAMRDAIVADASAAVGRLKTSFFATPYRPTGLSTGARTLVRLVDQVVWLDSILERMRFEQRPEPTDSAVGAVKAAAATLLEHAAAVLRSAVDDPALVQADLARLREARAAMEQVVTTTLPVRHAARVAAMAGSDGSSATGSDTRSDTNSADPDSPDAAAAEFVSSLEPSFRAQEMSFAVTAIAANIELTVAARARTWWQTVVGHQPQDGAGSLLTSAQQRAGAHVEWHSVWLHNSLRGAIALAAAVVIADLTGVQHSFWVVLGTLAVLRSSALNTGQNALRGLVGTTTGIIVGGVLVYAVGTNTAVYWALLPLGVAFSGLAPVAISFAAGQAGFTAMMLILYNIIEPAGWKIGLVRIEDVAIGCAVSLVGGALFWPRGAAYSLGQSIAEALTDSARYLSSAVQYGVSRCDRSTAPAAGPPLADSRRAAAAARRLDDAFRGFLAERGTKHLPLADVAAMINSVAVLRLTADAVLDLWSHGDDSSSADRAAARAELLGVGGQITGWYEQTAQAVSGAGVVPEPTEHDLSTDGRLIAAVRRDLSGEDGQGTATAVKVIWTAEHLDAVRRLQRGVAGPAAAAAKARAPRAVPRPPAVVAQPTES
ncbi:MAG TPA: FUSC family protein [Actinocrinis sp.]|jgi:uncharacterized membrane protein YccC